MPTTLELHYNGVLLAEISHLQYDEKAKTVAFSLKNPGVPNLGLSGAYSVVIGGQKTLKLKNMRSAGGGVSINAEVA